MQKLVSIFSLSSYVFADWQKMNQDYNDLVYQKVEALANNTDLYDFSEDFESVVKKLTTVDLSIIEDYGCYCNFNSENNNRFREKAKGRPLDDIDRFCKALHDGYTCAQVDTNNSEDKECTPWEVKYNSAFNNGLYHDLRMDQLSYLCKKANTKNSCAAMACQIEGWFVQSFFTYFASGGRVDLNNLKHSNGFKHKNNCFGNVKELEELDCCNNFPLRYPFRNKEGTKKCCRSVTYNVFTHQCCDDGTVRMDCNNLYEDDQIEPYIDIFLNNDNNPDHKQNKDQKEKHDPNELITSTDSNESSIPEPILITDLNAIGTESVTATSPVTESSLVKSTSNDKKKNHRIKSKDIEKYSAKTEYGRKVLRTRLEKLGLIDKL